MTHTILTAYRDFWHWLRNYKSTRTRLKEAYEYIDEMHEQLEDLTARVDALDQVVRHLKG